VSRATRYCILGAHVAPEAGDVRYFDGVDLVVTVDDGRQVVAGLRTHGFMGRLTEAGSAGDPWIDGYEPVPITLDPTTVTHWDFNALLWVGPEPHPCLLWCNADYVSAAGVGTLLFPADGPHRMLDGPTDRGLPTAEELQVELPAVLQWQAI
jgi:hypothetical protein